MRWNRMCVRIVLNNVLINVPGIHLKNWDRMLFLSAAILCGSIVGAIGYTPAALKDQIKNLPGIPSNYESNMFSGYIPVTEDGSKQLFYWYVESQRNPDIDPLVLWTNGGPGCSGLSGFLTEQGPFRPTAGLLLTLNTYSWNRISNMVFIEQPVGVGFSFAKNLSQVEFSDRSAATDNYLFVKGFLERFPNLKKNDFYISSESYGGHYIPTLAKELVVRGDVNNFKGLLVGNPLTYMPYRDYGQFSTLANHQLVPKPLWDRYVELQCHYKNHSGECGDIEGEMMTITKGLDPYALDFPVCLDKALSSGRDERMVFARSISAASHYFPESYTKCEENFTEAFLNNPQVKQALHVRPDHSGVWGVCNSVVEARYNKEDVNREMMSIYKFLIDGGYNLKILIYSGDNDSICATAGTQQFIWDMGYDVLEKWSSWKTKDGQVAGFRVSFQGKFF